MRIEPLPCWTLLCGSVLAAALVGCPAGDDDDSDGPPYAYPLDDVLHLQDVQALGTHNSYHVMTPGTNVEPWMYSHLPLDEQLGELGVRQFELDLNYLPDEGRFEVYHVALLDEATTCRRLEDCLAALDGWSRDHSGHHPYLVLLEVKDPYSVELAVDYLDDLDAAIRDGIPAERLLTPDLVQGGHDSLRDALAAGGWPTLGAVRGRGLFVLHTSGAWIEAYTDGGTTTAGRALFPDAHGDLEVPYAAVHTLNDPVGDLAAIQAAVTAGHLVRTRADVDSEQAVADDPSRAEAALASGAQFVSTDWPAPHPDTGYQVVIPGGTPSRCNPLVAPPECTSEAVEDPALLPWPPG